MNAENLILIGVALVAIIGAAGAFTIAYRRSQPEPDALDGVSKETLAADRSMEGVRVEPIVTTSEGTEAEDEVDDEENVVVED